MTAGSSPSLLGVSSLNARSYSFTSPSSRSTPRPHQKMQGMPRQHLRTPRPSFLQSPSMLFSEFNKKEGGTAKGEKVKEMFLMYLRFHRRLYDEMVYMAKMRPSLDGLVSIVLPHGKRRRFGSGGGNAQLQHHHRI